jgi:hypothetical protein
MSVRSNVPVRLFLKRSMIKSVVILLVYALQQHEFYKDYQELGRRVSLMMQLSGTKCTINYLKECTRVLVRWLANQDRGQLNVPVKLSHSGLPMIIPGRLRYSIQLLRSGESTSRPSLCIRGVLTLLQLWRAMRVRGCVPNFWYHHFTVHGIIRTIKVPDLATHATYQLGSERGKMVYI